MNLPNKRALFQRAAYLRAIRCYFDERGIIEVETPLAYTHPVTDPYIDVFAIETQSGKRFLQSSPEYAMKRLLAEGIGDIYQICKAFRDDPKARLHHHEFTMLEWYRIGIDHHALMKEIEVLIRCLKKEARFCYVSYQALFEQYLGINPHVASHENLQALVNSRIGDIRGLQKADQSTCLDLLFTHGIEPCLPSHGEFIFIYHYPASQAALAKVIEDENGQKVAARFELYYRNIELANGYYELNHPKLLEKALLQDIQLRSSNRLKPVQIDRTLLEAAAKIPDCSGVAMGLDRLFMCLGAYQKLSDVSFLV